MFGKLNRFKYFCSEVLSKVFVKTKKQIGILNTNTMKRLVIFAVALAVAVACSPKGQNPYEYTAPEFKKTYKVDIVPLNNDLIISNVVQLFQYEDKLIARTKNIDNKNVFQVISLKDGTFLGSFGMVGRGDKELVRYYCLSSP